MANMYPVPDRLFNAAVSAASTGAQDPELSPHSNGVRSGSQLAGANYSGGRVQNPSGSLYDRMRPAMVEPRRQQIASVSALSARLSAQSREESIITNNTPATFGRASFSSHVTHSDLPLDRTRIEDIYSNDINRGFAF